MKKIYILTAVCALLTLSLNAQLTTTKKKVVKPVTSTEKVVTPPDGYFRVGPSRASTDPVTTFPYYNRFDSETEWNWWETIDVQNDGNDGYGRWELASNQARYTYDSGNAADDWLITAPIHLEAGKTYKFYIDAYAQSTYFTERLEVKLASANTAAALSAGVTVISSTDITWSENDIRTLSNENVTVSTTGNYYFGIHAISDRDRYYLWVDDLVIDVENTDPVVTVSPTELTISDSGTNNTFTTEAHNIIQGENLGVTPHNGFSTTCTSSTNNVDTWGFYQNNGSVNGTVAVNYTGRALTASDDIAVGTLGASTTVHVNYVPNLYIYCDYGASPWDFSANPAVAMVNNGDGTYTATLQNIPANSHILFGRAEGLTYYWEGDDNRLFFGASTDGGDWGYGDNTSGYLDTDANDDYPVKYHPIYFSEGGTYTITINANDYTFTINKLVYPAPENVVATADSENQTATVTWDAPSNLPTETGQFTWDFEAQSQANEWTLVNVDGDSYNWEYFTFTDGSAEVFTPHSGTYCMRSASFINNIGALTPNNWMISPEVQLGGTLTLWAKGTDTNDFAEKFGVYVYQGSYSSGTSGFVQVGADITTTLGWSQYTFDLSQYQGEGRIAIVHHNVTNMYWLLVDDIDYIAEIPIEPESYNIYLDGQLVGSVNANNALTYNFSNLAVGDHECAVSAVYPGGIESEAVPAQFSTLPKTATPTIEVVTNADGSKTITAVGNGTVHLYVDGNEVSNPYTIQPSVDGDITVTVTATAQEEGKLISDPATQTVTVPEAGRSPMPTITFTDNGDGSYTITATGTGEVNLYINDPEHGGTAGTPVATGQGSVSITVEQHSQEMTIPLQATNQEEGLAVSRTAEATYTIPAMSLDGFTPLDPQPANASTPIDMSNLMFVDRFSVLIPATNDHPTLYDYYLQENQVRQRTSNSVEVPVKHTGSDGLGFYTLDQIDNDVNVGIYHDKGLKMNVRNAAMDLPLESDPSIYFYTVSRGTAAYPNQADRKYTGVLQRTSDGNYQETLNPSYDYEAVYPGGQHHIHLDTDTITGDYNNYLAYVPIVWTMGFDRVNYETDQTHNSYGAPKWKTGVAQVNVQSVNAERQTGVQGSTNWMEGSIPCSMYMIDEITAVGTMPSVNTMPYKPYMFRVFVESKNGKLRGYKKIGDGATINDATHYEGDGNGPQTGPFCIWSEYVDGSTCIGENGYEYTFSRGKISEVDSLGHWIVPDYKNIMFAAEDNLLTEINQFGQEVIQNNELNIFVRFYYIVEGADEGHTIPASGPYTGQRNRDGEAPGGYGSESPGTSPSPSTAVNEISLGSGVIVSQTFYNAQGMTSDKPFDGINIVITRYSDGTTRTTKVVR